MLRRGVAGVAAYVVSCPAVDGVCVPCAYDMRLCCTLFVLGTGRCVAALSIGSSREAVCCMPCFAEVRWLPAMHHVQLLLVSVLVAWVFVGVYVLGGHVQRGCAWLRVDTFFSTCAAGPLMPLLCLL